MSYPPGVSGSEPELTGVARCVNCRAVLPEEAEIDCPECDGTGYCGLDADPCIGCDGTGLIQWVPDDECPGGCDEQ